MIYHITWRNEEQFIQDCIKHHKVLWACAYKVNNESLHVDLHKKPVRGIITEMTSHSWSEYGFAELKKDGTPKKSGQVSVSARIYADTYAECVQAYNAEVLKRKNRLLALAKACDDDFLELPVTEENSAGNVDTAE